MNTIQHEWEQFREMVIPKDAPEIQFQEMEIAFHGGALAMKSMIDRVGSQTTDEAFLQIILSWEKELEDFCQRLNVERAKTV